MTDDVTMVIAARLDGYQRDDALAALFDNKLLTALARHDIPHQGTAPGARLVAAVKKIGEFIRTQDAEIVNGFPFIPHPQPGKLGPVYEFRYYELKPGKLPETAKGWESKIGERSKMSPIVFAGGVELGTANGFVHVWAYPGMDARMKIRDEARQKGVWPPPSGGGPRLNTQKNKIMLPSSFSPLQ